MSEAIVRVTRVEDERHEIEYEIIATRGVTNLWDAISDDEANRLGLALNPYGDDDEIEDPETDFEIEGVKYHYSDGYWFTPGDTPETAADDVRIGIEEAIADEGATVGDLFAVDIDYEGDGCWGVYAERTLSTVLAPAEAVHA